MANKILVIEFVDDIYDKKDFKDAKIDLHNCESQEDLMQHIQAAYAILKDIAEGTAQKVEEEKGTLH